MIRQPGVLSGGQEVGVVVPYTRMAFGSLLCKASFLSLNDPDTGNWDLGSEVHSRRGTEGGP